MSAPLFLGVHTATIDAEGRIQLPAALRDEVNVRQPEFGLMATWEAEGNLCLRLRPAFDDWIAGLREAATTRSSARRTLLTIAAHTAPVKCDRQGRIRVPDGLLELVGVDRRKKSGREVVLVGDFGELRLWRPEAWAEWSEAARGDLSLGLDAILDADRERHPSAD